MKLFAFLTGRTFGRGEGGSTGKDVRFSRAGEAVAYGDVVELRPTGLPSPNSAFSERVREFFASRAAEGESIRETAERVGRQAKRFYHESDGSAPLSLDFVFARGAELGFRDRLILARYLMDRWGLRAEVGRLPGLEERP